MGQTLSAPVEKKLTETGGNNRYAFAISEMQGWRVSMEDAHTVLLKLNDDADDNEADAFFAVYDGHGGASVAKYAGENVYRRLAKEESYRQRQYDKALKRAFMGTDEDLRADPAFFRDPSGCTAVAALITHDSRIFVANAGDSRSVLCVAGEAKPMSFDHKPDNEVEYNRIKAAGGYIEGGRVCGNLSLSRAIGDFQFKKEYSLEPEAQIITSNPDIMEHFIGEDDEFLIIACDGIWDCLTSQQCCNYIRRSLQKRKTLPEICESIMDHCISPDSNGGIGMDNMTILVVAILHGKTLEEWYEWVAQRVEDKVGFETPEEFPFVYSSSRLMMAAERQRRLRENPRAFDDDDDDLDDRPVLKPGPGLSRILVGGTDVSFMSGPERGISSVGRLFGDDSSDEDNDDIDEELRKWNSAPDIADIAELDDDQLDSLMGSFGDPTKRQNIFTSSNDYMDQDIPESNTQGEAPMPPKSNDSNSRGELSHLPDGDEQHSSTKIEGFLDSTEDPLVTAVGGT